MPTLQTLRPAARLLALTIGFYAAAGAGQNPQASEWRTWNHQRGNIEGALLGVDQQSLILQARDGRTASLPLGQFSAEDAIYAKARLPPMVKRAVDATAEIEIVSLAGKHTVTPSGSGWGERVIVDPGADDAILTDAKGGGAVFKSRNFGFTCEVALPEPIMRDIARVFELVHHLHRMAPWHQALPPVSDQGLQVLLMPDLAVYRQAGGAAGTAWDFDPNRQLMRCSMEAIGLRKTATGWVKSHQPLAAREAARLITVALLHEAAPFMPEWLVPGMADFFAEIPMVDGTAWPGTVRLEDWLRNFSSVPPDAAYLADMLTAAPTLLRVPMSPPPAPTQLSETAAELQKRREEEAQRLQEEKVRLEKQSVLHTRVLVWHFLQAEGAPPPLARLGFAAHESQSRRQAYDDSFRTYEAELAAFMKQPGVVDLGKGRFQYPAGMTPPAPPLPFPFPKNQPDFLQRMHVHELLAGQTPAEAAAQALARLTTAGAPAAQVSVQTLRGWKNSAGRTLEATLQGFKIDAVMLRRADGSSATVPIAQLSPADQQFVMFHIADLLEGVPALATATPVPSAPAVQARASWPGTLTAPDLLTNATYLARESAPGRHLYRTSRFQYTVHADVPLNATLMKNLARVFEGTYELMKQSPFGLQARPKSGFFEAHFYPDRRSYVLAGGPDMSGGVYRRNDRVFLVPFESLGIARKGDLFVKQEDYQIKTLVHELTHMLMHDILPVVPQWFAEGSAEYTETIPFRNGVFNCDGILAGVKAYNVKAGGLYPFAKLLDLSPMDWNQVVNGAPAAATSPVPGTVAPVGIPILPVSNDKQRSLYHSSLLMTFYFMHLDGDRQGSRLLKFLDACRAEKAVYDAYQAAFAAYRKELDEFLKHPEVKTLADGRFEYPTFLNPPQPPAGPKPQYQAGRVDLVHMDLLLAGRTREQLVDEMVTALKSAGLQLF